MDEGTADEEAGGGGKERKKKGFSKLRIIRISTNILNRVNTDFVLSVPYVRNGIT